MLPRGLVPSEVQDLIFLFTQLHQDSASPTLQPAGVPLPGPIAISCRLHTCNAFTGPAPHYLASLLSSIEGHLSVGVTEVISYEGHRVSKRYFSIVFHPGGEKSLVAYCDRLLF